MKKFLSLITIILLPLLAMAQTQQGYVRTLDRPDNAGKPLSGVTIRQTGAHNAVVSNASGTFSLNMSGKKLGDPYSLQQVRKDKYELVEHDAIGRKYAYSNSVPLTIVMVSTEQMEKDKMRIENNAYKRAEKDYKTKSAALEKQLNEKTISEEKYQQEIQALINNFDKYQSMIESLADHYARTDYDALDEREREINICIENGDLERADSLLHTIDNFDPIEVLKRNKEAMAKFDTQIAQAEGMIAEANADMAEVLRRQEKDAEYLYQLYTIALARYDNEKAAKYIETRAALDTTNVDWQLEAGKFIMQYIANYDKALKYYNCALRNAIKQYGESHPKVAFSYNYIGNVYYYQGNYNDALNYCQKALEIFLQVYGESHHNVAMSYNNIGSVYSSQGNYNEALNYYQNALEIRLQLLGESHPDVTTSYNNIGLVYQSQGNYTDALNYHQKALDIFLQLFGENHPNVAMSYNNIGSVYSSQGNYNEALNYLQKALEIRLQLLGESHPDVATSYNNIGVVFKSQGNYNDALNYYQKALEIYLQVYGESHPHVATSYNNIGSVLDSQGNYNEALNYYQKALEIRLRLLGESHPDVANSYSNIGNVLDSQGNYNEALNYYQKALEIYLQCYGEVHSDVADEYNNIGSVYYAQGKYNEALKYYQKTLEIRLQLLGESHPYVATSYNNIGSSLANQGNYNEALNYYQKALEIRLQLFGENHLDVANCYYGIAGLNYALGDYINTITSCDKSLNFAVGAYGNENPRIKQLYMYKYSAYCKLVKQDASYISNLMKFMENIVFTATMVEGDTPASKQGLTGEYYLFEIGDWDMESLNSLWDKNAELQGKPKTLVLMKEGKVSSHYFENSIGCQFGVKWISKEKKQQILEQYRKWKESQN